MLPADIAQEIEDEYPSDPREARREDAREARAEAMGPVIGLLFLAFLLLSYL